MPISTTKLLLIGLLLLVLACKSTSPQKRPVSSIGSFLESEERALVPPPELRPMATTTKEKVIDLAPTGSSSDLLAASMKLRQGKSTRLQSPPIEITDENLHSFSNGAKVIIVEGGRAEERASNLNELSPAADQPPPAGLSTPEWRSAVAELKSELQGAIAQCDKLDLTVSSLRELFYSEPDAVVREVRIRPDWQGAVAASNKCRQAISLLLQRRTSLLESAPSSTDRDWAESLLPDPTPVETDPTNPVEG